MISPKIIALLSFLVSAYSLTQYKVTTKDIGTSKVKLGLQYTGTDEYYVKQKSKIIKKLQFEFVSHTFFDFRFKIYDPTKKRYQVPQGGIFPSDPDANSTFPLSLADFTLNFTEDPFSFTIIRKSDNSLLFSSVNFDLIYSEYYIQIGTQTSSKTIYGFSERFTNSFRLKPGKWTMFPRDRGQMMDYGIGKQTHGYYPIYFQREKDKKFHMSYFRSSNALDVITEDGFQDNYKLTYKTIGGIIDFRFFLTELDPEILLTKFHKYLGQSAVPPFWSLGFHQCRWGYQNVQALENVLGNYEKNNIPLDTIWTDIDYMKDFETFTIDEDRFPLDRMSKILQNYHYIPIVEPSIRNNEGYAFEEGKKRNVFIKDAEGGDQIGKVWAGQVLFTDYFHPNATQYWIDMLQHLYSKIKFSGTWLDMNQISNLCNGPCSPPEKTGMDYTNDIPYQPGNDSIQTQAIPLNATHYQNRLQANVHTFFGFMETYATNKFLEKYGRPFIITRSNTLGSNRYGFHWTGDNYANFQFLKLSIAGNFMFNFWGIQMVGGDICGFGGNATEENCARWFQVGSLYPFARDHNQIQAYDQQPYALGKRVLKSSQVNLKLRYSILKSYYREFINKKGSGSIYKPLFLQFPMDSTTYNDDISETEFMIGKMLLGAPIVQQGTTKRSVYFPEGSNWYDFYSGAFFSGKSVTVIENEMDDLVPLYLREGHMTFTQNVDNITKSSQLGNQFTLVGGFAFDQKNSTQAHERYTSAGGLLSIKNYNNESKIKVCLSKGCDYEILAVIDIVKPLSKTLTLNIVHLGDKSTKEEIIISNFVLYTKDKVYRFKSKSPVKITGNGRKDIIIETNMSEE